jgi:acylphosphatase
MITARRITVRGRVQGVGYRAWTMNEAERRGLRGWVRNRRDGSVEALLIGDEAAVAAMIALCRKGPPAALVDAVESAEAQDNNSSEFLALPTA